MTLPDGLLPQSAPRILKTALARFAGLDELERLYRRTSGEHLLRSVLEDLDIRWSIDSGDAQRIPSRGPAIVVSNHPTGMLDGLVLGAALLERRPDVKILGNQLLGAVPELQSLLIPVNLSADAGAVRQNAAQLRRAMEHIAQGGLLLIFPAGVVSRFDWRTREVSDCEWSPAAAKLIRSARRRDPRLTVVPVHISASNSALFHVAGALHSRLRLFLMARELLNKRSTEVRIVAGRPLNPSKLAALDNDRECAEYLRWRTYLLARRPALRTQVAAGFRQERRVPHQPVIDAVEPEKLHQDIQSLPPERKLGEAGDLTVYLASASEIPSVLTEISRLREITFRAVAEGTGRACDRDAFDRHYSHLFLWNESKREVAGAYRLAMTSQVRRSQGKHGLYTATLFRYSEPFLDQLGPAIELGRSFVRIEYQRGFAPLLLLWRGIGRFVSMHPECRVLFGPVSISSQYQSISKELMAAYLERHAPLTELLGMVSGRMPFHAACRIPEAATQGLGFDDLSSVIADIEPDGRGAPVLLRQYLKLGGRLLGFNIDPEFSGTLDGLIVVDLLRTDRSLLERYLGKAESAALLRFHNAACAA
ncbi:MAG: lysophospholipid acyltransferase family protein [Bryobacterales bacterium]|nr:lysophospholipid acyltransferase family protein [Bryobacterales bacterium]